MGAVGGWEKVDELWRKGVEGNRFVWVCVCMSVWVSVRMDVCMSAWVSVCMFEWLSVHM